jgi:hypothetical protein
MNTYPFTTRRLPTFFSSFCSSNLLARATQLTACLSVALVASNAAAQSKAVMLDGRVLTQKVPLSHFATEGPIWNLDLKNQGIVVTGRTVTIPRTVNGLALRLSGSSITGKDGTAGLGIGAADFHRLLDRQAITTDRDFRPEGPNLGPRRIGATRSIFSTAEAQNLSTIPGVIRDLEAQAAIEENYFSIVKACHAQHANVLPANFLERAGLHGSNSDNWAYPGNAGGTLKSAGTIYTDTKGKEYLVPDEEVVIELSENVAGGIVRSRARGNATTPDSFVIGDMLLVFNQDPRFGADILGTGGAILSRETFFDQIGAGVNAPLVIGHMVGEHVMFVHEIDTTFIDPSGPLYVTADRIQVREGSQEVRWIGATNKPEEFDQLFAVLIVRPATRTVKEIRQSFPITITPDPLGGATYVGRLRALPGFATFLPQVTHLQMEARRANGTVVATSDRIDIAPFRQ